MFVIRFYHSDLKQSAVYEHTFSITVLDPSAFNCDYGFIGHQT